MSPSFHRHLGKIVSSRWHLPNLAAPYKSTHPSSILSFQYCNSFSIHLELFSRRPKDVAHSSSKNLISFRDFCEFSITMVCCLMCDESRKVVGSHPTRGVCNNCGGSLSKVRVRNMFRLCFVPICCSHNSRIMCSRCGTQYRR